MSSYHVSNLGSFSGGVQSDIDGYVHLTAEAVLAGNWDGLSVLGRDVDDLDDEEIEYRDDLAEEIASRNRRETESSEAAIGEWRQAD